MNAKQRARGDWRQAVAGVSAGAIPTMTMYPLDVIKVRFQGHQGQMGLPRVSTWQLGRSIVAREGALALYRGLTPSLIGASVSWGLYFFFYDKAKARRSLAQGSGQLSAPQ